MLDKCSKALGEIVEGEELTLGPKLKKARVEPSQTDRYVCAFPVKFSSNSDIFSAVELSTEERPGPFQRLAILAEVLASLSVTSVANSTTKSDHETLPHSFDLITHLLESLSQIIRFHASGASINSSSSVEFICQNIMASIDGVAAGVRDPPNISPTPIRLDVLVEIIRVSSNPQTLHQALLLIAGLARLAPESVLRNVMPVFTFMGVGAAAMAGGGPKAGIEIGGGMSMLSRDDGYGWGIVQKVSADPVNQPYSFSVKILPDCRQHCSSDGLFAERVPSFWWFRLVHWSQGLFEGVHRCCESYPKTP